MTLRNAQAGVQCARCRLCDHDLMVRGTQDNPGDGKVYCSNRRCGLNKREHPTGSHVAMVNAPLHMSYPPEAR